LTNSHLSGVHRRGLLKATLVVPAGVSQAISPDSAAVVDARHFGAVCDGVVDDTDALQAAIDKCLESNPPLMLAISGRVRVTRELKVKRNVDRSKGRFRIVGTGNAPAIVTDRALTLFGAGGPIEKFPSSEFISFEDIHFEAATSVAQAFVMSGAFLRVEFVGCDFHAIACVDSPIYAQEWRFYRCVARYWKGSFFRSAGGDAVTTHGSKYQHGGAVFEIVDPTGNSGCVGCSFHQDIVESSLGPFLSASFVQGLSIAGLYSEGNGAATLRFGSKGPNRGINVSGCFFAPQDGNKGLPDFFDIVWGQTIAGFSSGNTALGGLHDDVQAGKGFVTVGDHSQGKLSRTIR
jgi:hypothetical protein